jgi:OPT oligopeptide transporter protein
MHCLFIGNEYNQTAILTNNRFDPEKFASVGPAWFSASNALSLITNNLAMGATSVQYVISLVPQCVVMTMVEYSVFLFYWPELKPFFRAMNPWNNDTVVTHDEHYEKMKVYKKVPKIWFIGLLAGAYAVAQATNYTEHSDFNWWSLTVVSYSYPHLDTLTMTTYARP